MHPEEVLLLKQLVSAVEHIGTTLVSLNTTVGKLVSEKEHRDAATSTSTQDKASPGGSFVECCLDGSSLSAANLRRTVDIETQSNHDSEASESSTDTFKGDSGILELSSPLRKGIAPNPLNVIAEGEFKLETLSIKEELLSDDDETPGSLSALGPYPRIIEDDESSEEQNLILLLEEDSLSDDDVEVDVDAVGESMPVLPRMINYSRESDNSLDNGNVSDLNVIEKEKEKGQEEDALTRPLPQSTLPKSPESEDQKEEGEDTKRGRQKTANTLVEKETSSLEDLASCDQEPTPSTSSLISRVKEGTRASAARKNHYQCDICRKVFIFESMLKRHYKTHSGEKPHKCPECKKAFTQLSDLKRHKLLHTGQKPFKCTVCRASFRLNWLLQTHMFKHSREWPFNCKMCGRGFSHASAYQVHMRSHSGHRPFSCDLCEMMFSRRGDLNRHRITHSGERPYACTFCSAAFAHKCSLKTHIRIHTGEKPYRCDRCGKAFNHTGDLKKHVRVHLGERPFKCDDCGRRFTDKGNLNKHCRTQHKK